MSGTPGYQILVDGYNVIKRNPELAKLSLEQARKQLASRLTATKWPFPVQLIHLIFDAKDSDGSSYRISSTLQIRFADDADEAIQQQIRKLPNPRQSLLISDDQKLRSTAKAHGVSVLSSSCLFGPKRAPVGSVKKQAEPEKISQAEARRINEELSKHWLA